LFRYVYASTVHSPDYIIDANGVDYRVLRDQLGSPLLIVNTTNAADVMLNAGYSAFGRRTLTSGAVVIPTHGFAGGIYDEDTELTRFGARDYDPVVGRWTAKDPIQWRGLQANLYAYASNDPVNLIATLGLHGLLR
jgi:RHS repeat-associated protein